jgi:hypothetical protein
MRQAAAAFKCTLRGFGAARIRGTVTSSLKRSQQVHVTNREIDES